jgi:hypothetical protein
MQRTWSSVPRAHELAGSASPTRRSPDGGRIDRVHAELFAAGRDDPRARRPSDLLRAVAWVGLLVLASVPVGDRHCRRRLMCAVNTSRS